MPEYHPCCLLAAEIIKSLSEEDIETLEEALREQILEDDTTDSAKILLETWEEIKAGNVVEQTNLMGLAIAIQDMVIASLHEQIENGSEGEEWRN